MLHPWSSSSTARAVESLLVAVPKYPAPQDAHPSAAPMSSSQWQETSQEDSSSRWLIKCSHVGPQVGLLGVVYIKLGYAKHPEEFPDVRKVVGRRQKAHEMGRMTFLKLDYLLWSALPHQKVYV
jgi:hypothetical protein